MLVVNLGIVNKKTVTGTYRNQLKRDLIVNKTYKGYFTEALKSGEKVFCLEWYAQNKPDEVRRLIIGADELAYANGGIECLKKVLKG